jgi:hypothetical protein
MQLVDHIFILLLFVVQPVYGVFESRRYDARAKAGWPVDRIRFYRQTALLEWTFLALLTGYLLYSWRWAKRASATDKAKQVESIGKVVQFLPHTIRELRSFVGVSITAGVVEEIVYRGFVLWYLAQFMPLWVAVAVSSVAFGLAHGYQGANGALRCGLLGLAFGIFYVVTGSIWLPIVAHALLDVLQGATIYEILRKDDDALEPQLRIKTS